MKFEIDIDQSFTPLIEDHPQEVKKALSRAVGLALMNLNDAIMTRDAAKPSCGGFRGV